jgi:hypothetical protein
MAMGFYDNKGRRCGPIKNTSFLWRMNDNINEYARFLNVSAVLPALDVSLDMHGDHLELHTPHVRKRHGTDCTHFCEPSILFQTLNMRLAKLVQGRLELQGAGYPAATRLGADSDQVPLGPS